MKPKTAAELHHNLPPGYYEKSIKRNPFQRFWHLQRFKHISRLVEATDGKILDVGSADGTFTKVLAKKSVAKRVIGIDVVKSSVDYARRRFQKNNQMQFLLADAHRLPFANNYFDAVFCLEALEHVFDPRKVVREIKRVLKSGGYVVVLVPTESPLFKIAWWIVLHTWGKHWRETHIQSFKDKNYLAKILRNAGLAVEEDKKFLLGMLEAIKARKA